MVVKLEQLHGWIWIVQAAIVAIDTSTAINKCLKVYLAHGYTVQIKDTPENRAALWGGAMVVH